MAGDHLYVWDDGRRAGVFTESATGRIEFAYDKDATRPLSLSLPLEGGWKPEAPYRFLDGLLPDDEGERIRMRVALGASGMGLFGLLDRVDVVGGLVFSTMDEPLVAAPSPLRPAASEDIAARIVRLQQERSAWWERDGRTRFSLAGTQGKFTLSWFQDRWFWPNVSMPSTHIVKPPARAVADADIVEHLSMNLAAACGLDVPEHALLQVGEARAYMVGRFDRVLHGDAPATRLRIEDLTQAMGLPKEEKYYVEIGEVIVFLRMFDPSDELGYAWLSQVMFNVLIGNCDAHAKNYSLYLDGDAPRLCPLYDCLVTRYWPDFDRELAMQVNDVPHAEDVTEADWAAEAAADGLDAGRVVDRVRELSKAMRDAAPTVLTAEEWSRPVGKRLLACLEQTCLPRRGCRG